MSTIHIITFNGKPATIETLEDLERKHGNCAIPLLGFDPEERPTFIAAGTKEACKEYYNSTFGGYTWRERPEGVECSNVKF